MNVGIYPALSNDEYHNDVNSISRSAIMDYRKSPYTYWANYLNPARPRKEKTPAMIFGSAFHEYILEPLEFNKHYACEPMKVLLKNVGRERYDEFKEYCAELEASGKIVLTDDEFLTIRKMQEALLNHKEAKELFIGGVYESAYVWKDEHSGLICKAKPDILHDNMIVDIKTCADASPRAFQSAMVSGGYHIQGAMIRDGIEALTGRRINHFICIAIEKTYPYSIGVYIIDEAALEVGHCEYKQIILDMKTSLCENTFQDFEIQTISLPRWYEGK